MSSESLKLSQPNADVIGRRRQYGSEASAPQADSSLVSSGVESGAMSPTSPLIPSTRPAQRRTSSELALKDREFVQSAVAGRSSRSKKPGAEYEASGNQHHLRLHELQEHRLHNLGESMPLQKRLHHLQKGNRLTNYQHALRKVDPEGNHHQLTRQDCQARFNFLLDQSTIYVDGRVGEVKKNKAQRSVISCIDKSPGSACVEMGKFLLGPYHGKIHDRDVFRSTEKPAVKVSQNREAGLCWDMNRRDQAGFSIRCLPCAPYQPVHRCTVTPRARVHQCTLVHRNSQRTGVRVHLCAPYYPVHRCTSASLCTIPPRAPVHPNSRTGAPYYAVHQCTGAPYHPVHQCTVPPRARVHRCTVLPRAQVHRCTVLPRAPVHQCTGAPYYAVHQCTNAPYHPVHRCTVPPRAPVHRTTPCTSAPYHPVHRCTVPPRAPVHQCIIVHRLCTGAPVHRITPCTGAPYHPVHECTGALYYRVHRCTNAPHCPVHRCTSAS